MKIQLLVVRTGGKRLCYLTKKVIFNVHNSAELRSIKGELLNHDIYDKKIKDIDVVKRLLEKTPRLFHERGFEVTFFKEVERVNLQSLILEIDPK